jgi:hypothetical protein
MNPNAAPTLRRYRTGYIGPVSGPFGPVPQDRGTKLHVMHGEPDLWTVTA